ncbi:MAG: MotA/TolQ/ExbB proton channel family protein [Bacteroidetes bacterium]|nr:MotA/TolQ/ExbB proton channel family protein [Bacteroidota bacterium]
MSLLTLLLQADTAVQAIASTTASTERISLFQLLWKGGILMIPLLFCSIAMVYVFTERYLAIKKLSNHDERFIHKVREQISNGNLSGAKSLCKNENTPEARIVEKGISRIGKPIDQIEKSMEATGKLQVYEMEKNLSILSTIASIAPMFGFLGTIFGMMILFADIQQANSLEINTLAGGIYTKMVTSAVGLIIGLLSYIGFRYLNSKINHAVNRMEATSTEFLDILHEPAK